MHIYFTDSQIPELSGLTKLQRRLIWRGAAVMLLQEQPSWKSFEVWFRISTFLLAGVIITKLGRSVSDFYLSLLAVISAGAILGITIGFTRRQFAIPRLLPYLRRFIEEHRDEISRTA